MLRRELLVGVSALAVASLEACAVRAQGDSHAHHAGSVAPPSNANRAVVDATERCRAAGERCLVHCNAALAAGHTAMAACQQAVTNMLAVIEAMHRTVVYGTANAEALRSLARACAQFCRACEAACEPHKAEHEECRACAEACAECSKACEALAAA